MTLKDAFVSGEYAKRLIRLSTYENPDSPKCDCDTALAFQYWTWQVAQACLSMILFSNLTSRTFILIASLIAFLWAAHGYPKWRKARKERLTANTAAEKSEPKSAQASSGDDRVSFSSLLNPRSIPVLPLAAVYIVLRATWDLFCLTVYYGLLGCENLGARFDTALFHFVTVRLPVILDRFGHWWTHTGIKLCQQGWRYTTTTLLPSLVKAIAALAWQVSISWTALSKWISVLSVRLSQTFANIQRIVTAFFHAIETPVVWIAWRVSRLTMLISDGVLRISKALWRDICAVGRVGAKILRAFWNAVGYPITVFIVDKTEIIYRGISTVINKGWDIVATRLVLPLYRLVRPVAELMISKIMEVLLSERVKRMLRLRWKWTVSTLSLLTRDIGVFLQSAFQALDWLVVKVMIPFYRTIRYQLLPLLSVLYTRLRSCFWNFIGPILTAIAPLISPVVRACTILYEKFIYPALCKSIVDLTVWLINKIRFQHNLYRACQALYSQASILAVFIYNKCSATYSILSAFFWQHAPAITQLLAKISDQVVSLSAIAWSEAQVIGSQISTTISVQAEAVAQSLERVVGNWIDAQTDEPASPKLKTQ